jgi:Zn-finger nucleic acid-binding protein
MTTCTTPTPTNKLVEARNQQMPDYEPPEHKKEAFNCPHCQAYAAQNWYPAYTPQNSSTIKTSKESQSIKIETASCQRCKQSTIWVTPGEMQEITNPKRNPPTYKFNPEEQTHFIYPKQTLGQPAPENLNDQHTQLYEEARNIPRS